MPWQIKREIATMKLVKHPNVVQLLEACVQVLLALAMSPFVILFVLLEPQKPALNCYS